MNKVMTLVCLLVLVGGCILVIGCGNNNEKVAGIYNRQETNGQELKLVLTNDGDVTLVVSRYSHTGFEGGTHSGSFSYDGKKIKIRIPDNKLDETWQVAGNNLISTNGNVWIKQ